MTPRYRFPLITRETGADATSLRSDLPLTDNPLLLLLMLSGNPEASGIPDSSVARTPSPSNVTESAPFSSATLIVSGGRSDVPAAPGKAERQNSAMAITRFNLDYSWLKTFK